MPMKWTLEACTSRRSINQLETLHEYNFESMNRLHNLGSQIVIFKYSWTHCTPQVDLQYQFYPMSPWTFVDRCRQTQNLLKWAICEAALPIHCRWLLLQATPLEWRWFFSWKMCFHYRVDLIQWKPDLISHPCIRITIILMQGCVAERGSRKSKQLLWRHW